MITVAGITKTYGARVAVDNLTFDVAPGRVAKDLEQWQALCRWLDS